MLRLMGEQVAEAASRLGPLMAVVLGVFGVLILAAFLLRARVRAESWARQKQRSRWQPEVSQPCMVLGRAFTVGGLQTLADGARLLDLQGEETVCRLLIPAEGDTLLYFPGTLTVEGLEGFPQEISREQDTYRLRSAPLTVGAGRRLATYESGGKLLLLEELDGRISAWRGKAIPREGFGPLEK